MAALPEDERDWLMGHIRRHAAANWPEVKAGIEKAIRDLAERGFTTSFGEWEKDVYAVGVPRLVPPDESGVYAFNCGANVYQTSREKLEGEIGPRLVNLVKNVGSILEGWLRAERARYLPPPRAKETKPARAHAYNSHKQGLAQRKPLALQAGERNH